MFIRAMHNRPGPNVVPREMSVADGLVLVPLVLCILAFALYPQLALEKDERAVLQAVRPAAEIAVPDQPFDTAAIEAAAREETP
jgi:NADH-quinone oxidoreductase subunit M